jgi:hypothetical protein
MVKISLTYEEGAVILTNDSHEIIVVDRIGGTKVDPIRIEPRGSLKLEIKDRPKET